MGRVGSFDTDLRSEPYGVGPGPDPCFRVERSDGSHEIIDAADEADAIRQANNCYAGPAIVVSVSEHYVRRIDR